MSRLILGLVACWIPLSAIADDTKPALVEAYLHQGNFAEGEQALLLVLDTNADDDEARFGLGVIQFFRAVENLGQALYEYGASTERSNEPFLHLPIPPNSKPSTISSREFGRVLEMFISDLSRAETTLAAVKDDKVKLRLRLAQIQFDFVGNGKDRVRLLDVLTKLNGGRPFGFQDRNPDFRIHFDRGDVAWLRAYCHLLAAIANMYRAIDDEPFFEQVARDVFPQVQVNDIAAPVRREQVRIKDAPRLRRARLHLLALCELNQETWKYIRSETDDDYEWLSSSKQTEQLGLPISDQQVDGWLVMIKELEQLLQGKSLIPGELLTWLTPEKDYRGRGLNVQKLLDDPPGDFLNFERIQALGIDAKYIEELKGKKPFNLALIIQCLQLFDGNFGFARAARMN